MSTPELKITDKAVIRESKVGNQTIAEEKELFSTYEEISNIGYFDTGLLPIDGTGVLSIRQAGNRTQFVYQHAPGIYYMIWGKNERDTAASQIHVAQPYRIVIGDHVDGELRGARHFYSPVPITSIDQPLYHCNVPNLNCKGYSGTSVGWICLYHREKYAGLTLGQKIFKTVERASGHEAYNDANMSSTDGARFYAAHYKKSADYSYLWEPKKWEAKTDADGWDWVLNPDLWIPIRVKGIDSQDEHDPNGQVLTVEMAMLGNYKAYYPSRATDEKELSLMNQIRRADKKNPTQKTVQGLFATAFSKAKKKEEDQEGLIVPQAEIQGIEGKLLSVKGEESAWVPESGNFTEAGTPKAAAQAVAKQKAQAAAPWVAPKICWYCQTTQAEGVETFKDSANHLICESCFTTHFIKTDCCNLIVHAGDLFSWSVDAGNGEASVKSYCYGCHSLDTCVSCKKPYLDQPEVLYDDVCLGCHPEPSYCDSCGSKHAESKVQKVEAKDTDSDEIVLINGVLQAKTKMFTLCIPCFSNSALCACNVLKPDDTVATLPDGTIACESCIHFTPDGTPSYTPVNISVTV